MSRIPKWKVEKAKVKVVFRLQFHATHIPQPGWDKLFLTFIPVDTGKATAKTTKASVRNGNCKWSDPIYESTRLLRDSQSRTYDDKLYKLVVAMGSSRSSILGEATINLSDFVDALKPCAVALPLQGSDHGTILHATVQLLTSKTGFREFEQQRELSVKGLHTTSGSRDQNPADVSPSLEMTPEQRDKVNKARVRYKDIRRLPSCEEIKEGNGNFEDSVTGIDCSSNTSGSLYAERNETSSLHEVESLKSMASGDISVLPAAQSPGIVKGNMHDFQLSKRGSNDWIHGWTSDYSADNDITAAHEQNNQLKAKLEGVEIGFLQLKSEANSLQNMSHELGAETHNLTKQYAVEVASGEKLQKEVSIMKSECNRFKQELEELKSATSLHFMSGNGTNVQVAEPKWQQSLFLLEKKIREIQNKACPQYHGKDFNFLGSEFDVLHCILENLKQETFGIDHHHPDSELHSLINSPQPERNADNMIILEEKMCSLVHKLEESESEKEILTKKMEEMEHYYETLIQELEENRHQASNEFGILKAEHSSCLNTISTLQSQIEKLQEDMNGQFLRFAAERNCLNSLNKDLEKRAIVSENALKRVRLNYAIAVDRLQKDLELLSFQVLSMHETNENLAKHSFVDVSQLFPSQYTVMDSRVVKLQSEMVSSQTDCDSMMVNGNISRSEFPVNKRNTYNSQWKPENTETSPQLKEDKDTELSEMFLHNMHCEVFTVALKDSIFNAHDVVMRMKQEIVELTQQIEHSNYEKESLMLKSLGASDDIRKLREDEAYCRSRCDDLTLKNQILEAKVEDVLGERNSLTIKIAECEDKYKCCLKERNEFEDMFERENLQRNNLQEEFSSMTVNLKALKVEYENQLHLNSELQDTLCYLQKKLADLCSNMVSFSNAYDTSFNEIYQGQEMKPSDHMSTIMHLEILQKEAYKKIAQLHQEKEQIQEERYVVSCSLKSTESQILDLKQKLESELEETKLKLDFSNALVEKLKLEMVDVTNKLKYSSEAEEIQNNINKDLLAKLTILEIEIQQTNDENKDLYQKVLNLDRTKEELEKTRVHLMDCMQKNRALMMSIESENEASIQLENELNKFKEELKRSEDNLHLERKEREKLESRVADLTLHLNDTDHYLIEILDHLLSADVKATYLSCQFQMRAEELAEQRKIEQCILSETHEKNIDSFCSLNYKIAMESQRAEDTRAELNLSKALVEELQQELQDVTNKFKISTDAEEAHNTKNRELDSKLTILETEIQEYKNENNTINQKLMELERVKEELETSKLTIRDLGNKLKLSVEAEENHAIVNGELTLKLTILETEIQQLKDVNRDINLKLVELECINVELERTNLTLQEAIKKFQSSLEAGERHENTNKDLISKISVLEAELQKNKDENMHAIQKIEELKCIKEELERSLLVLIQEKEALMMLVKSGKDANIQLEYELGNLKEGLKCAHDDLHFERETRVTLEAKIANLNLQLKERDQQLLCCDEHISELSLVRRRVTNLELEMQHNLSNFNQHETELINTVSTLHVRIADLESHLVETYTQLLSADIKITYLTSQYQMTMEELIEQNKTLHGDFLDFQLKHIDIVNSVDDHIVVEAELSAENAKLFAALQSTKAELQSAILEKNSILTDMESKVAKLEADNCKEMHKYEGLEEEMETLWLSKLELEITGVILKSEFVEQQTHITLLEKCEHECNTLREQYKELSYKLSEQILKTEEFRNLSTHLREQKDKAEAECLQAQERIEAQGSTLALRDSLRIAFIKEQCESKLQEMKSQLVSCQKYAEEMLLKLQNALDEIETSKRNEASLAKINDDLTTKMSEVEIDLQKVTASRRELAKACDRMKAELECTVLSFDCCKEEKVKLEASLQECNDERKRLRVELDLVKRLLENMASSTEDVEVPESQAHGCSTSFGEVLEGENSQTSVYQEVTEAVDNYPDHKNEDIAKLADKRELLDSGRELQHPSLAFGNGSDLQGVIATRNPIDKQTLYENSTKHIADMKEHFKEQKKLLTNMDHLHKKLEMLKNENLSSVIPIENDHLDPALEALQSDLSQLDKANEHLESIFPEFKDIPGSGRNALDRVLALEYDLADSLQVKDKDVLFQSSFLKQHNDTVAIFKSFRDINDLMKDMLQMKKRNTAVETELKEMQSRYSQLSLQFAEVEGERQQLVMTLKNKSPRRSPSVN